MTRLKMMINFRRHASIEGLAAVKANLHCWILILHINGHGLGI